jgi:hypothetical protein
MLQKSFNPFMEQIKEMENSVYSIKITDISQREKMRQAHDMRMKLTKIRTEADKTRKTLKEDSLNYGKAVQAIYNIIEMTTKKAESYLSEQENFIINLEMKRKAELKARREMELQPYSEFVPFGTELANISEESFQQLLSNSKILLQVKIDREEKERIGREEQIKKEQEERERIRIENEKLRAERAEQEKLMQIEREKARREKEEIEKLASIESEKIRQEQIKQQNELEQERIKAHKLQQEIEKKKQSELAELKRKEIELKKAAAAPDKEKLTAYFKSISSIPYPIMHDVFLIEIHTQFLNVLQKIISQSIEKLNNY